MSFERIKLGIEYDIYTLQQLNQWVANYGVDSGLDRIRLDGLITQEEANELKLLIDDKIAEMTA